MRKSWIIITFLTAFTVLSAADFKMKNNFITLQVSSGGAVGVYAAGADKAAAVICPDFGGIEVVPRVVKRKNYDILLLRGKDEKRSLAVKLDKNSFSISLNRTGKPIKIKWQPAAVVLPDRAAEDIVLTAGKKDFRLPGFVNLYIGLLGSGEASLACIPVKNTADAVLSADLKVLAVNQKNDEEHIFVLNAAPGVWCKADKLVDGIKGITIEDWKAPYPASWCAAYPVDKGFLASGDGLHMSWNIITYGGGKKFINRMPRMAVLDIKTRRTWHGGLEGVYRYPAEFVDGKAVLTVPVHRSSRFSYAKDRPVFIYSWVRLYQTNPTSYLPADVLPPWKNSDGQWKTVNIGITPATCATTEQFEKIFYRDETAEKKGEIINSLWSMQCFVEAIRARIENARVWAADLSRYADDAVKKDSSLAGDAETLKNMLSDVEKFYSDALPKIKYPEEVVKLSGKVISLIDNSALDEEAKENEAKLLGRAIRTIGGGQDNLAASMRRVGKNVRRGAVLNYSAASTDAARAFWKHVWNSSSEMLQGVFNHEGK